MKKVLAIITMFSFMVAGEMGLSVYGGLGMTNVSSDDDNSVSGSKMGLNLGVTYDKLPVIVGAGFSMRGAKEDDITLKLNYIDLMALYPYAAGPGSAWVGLDIGINMSAKYDNDGTETDLKDSDCDDCINGLDYGLLFGYTYPLNETMGVSLGYYLGLGDWSGDGMGDSSDNNNGILMNLEYVLPY